jgi:hypothetical protein
MRPERIVLLAKLWAAVPIPPESVDSWLPEPHLAFIRAFWEIMMADGWCVRDYDTERWVMEIRQIVGDDRTLAALSLFELRDFLTYCCRGDCHSTGFLNSMASRGDIQKVLSRFAGLVEAGC